MRTRATIHLIACSAILLAAPAHAQERVATASAAPATGTAPLRSHVLHVPPSEARGARELRLVAVVDAAWTEAALVVRYRLAGSAGAFAESPFERSSAGGYYASIPADAVQQPGIEYFIVGRMPDGSEAVHFASDLRPYRVTVSPTQEERWAEKERRRVSGYVSSVSVDVRGHNFTNRYDNSDQFVRADLDFTHRLLLPRLYSISLGYGLIEGKTPDREGDQAMTVDEGARYGYGGFKLRFHDAVWIDARAGIGVSDDGFLAMIGGAITFGRPWRSNVTFGGEVVQDMGPSLWVRMQWDTVPPFLMAASVVKTDLPDARLPDGSFIVYDISYPVTPRLEIRGSLSFGSRDGPGYFGGGLGTSVSF